jgi:UDP-N-acetylglucosamine diphosphorylase / glucose-1-phosphate thymidylyltransferase / UDP-N-acetylgalactosamine diphosphorylase / glucosamine-1-phosphate N-acetyltransferase / galactosamine-1-phosphate N-acetyltransferase
MSNLNIKHYIQRFPDEFPSHLMPWAITKDIPRWLDEITKSLDSNYSVKNSIAIHKTANIEEHVILKGPLIIGPRCFIGSHAYLRGGVFLDENVSIGPGCEVKSSYLFSGTCLAHFNFVGDSILGSSVNMEAGSIVANHFNEREDKTIHVRINGKLQATDSTKFGALIGDGTKIGANAVLSPGTILSPMSIVKRLELIQQS